MEQLEAYIKQYQDLIFTICYRYTKDYFEAEDLAQDTFLSAYKNLASFDGANEKAWLCRIATNKCLDYLKCAKRRQIPTEDQYFAAIAVNTSTPEETCLEEDVKNQLYQYCCQLKSPYREVALDYYYHELDISQMVAQSGKNIKTLQSQIYRARSMLKKQYGKEYLSDGSKTIT